METPLGDRRARLEEALSAATDPIHLTPATHDLDDGGGVVRQLRGRGAGRHRGQAA